ncbi:UvrD-helicase domain-containing protein [Methanosarcina mazei]|nr:UvrD-helicase domain-containing protein [Methanosarcina mazei]
MINLALTNLQEKQNVLSDVKYLIVDEYQDINRAQEKLIQLIGLNSEIFIVGDPRHFRITSMKQNGLRIR